MERARVTDSEADAEERASVAVHHLSDALGTEHVALNHYRVPPGEGFPSGLHAHMDQEEVFVVLDGEATFETLERRITVGANEAIRFAPGEFQTGRNEGAAPLVALALGAPKASTDVRLPFACPNCGSESLRLDTRGALTFVCPGCGTERVPSPCSSCGSDDLHATVDGTQPVVACRACGGRFDRPPLEN